MQIVKNIVRASDWPKKLKIRAFSEIPEMFGKCTKTDQKNFTFDIFYVEIEQFLTLEFDIRVDIFWLAEDLAFFSSSCVCAEFFNWLRLLPTDIQRCKSVEPFKSLRAMFIWFEMLREISNPNGKRFIRRRNIDMSLLMCATWVLPQFVLILI